jgi:hypothetical protein
MAAAELAMFGVRAKDIDAGAFLDQNEQNGGTKKHVLVINASG